MLKSGIAELLAPGEVTVPGLPPLLAWHCMGHPKEGCGARQRWLPGCRLIDTARRRTRPSLQVCVAWGARSGTGARSIAGPPEGYAAASGRESGLKKVCAVSSDHAAQNAAHKREPDSTRGGPGKADPKLVTRVGHRIDSHEVGKKASWVVPKAVPVAGRRAKSPPREFLADPGPKHSTRSTAQHSLHCIFQAGACSLTGRQRSRRSRHSRAQHGAAQSSLSLSGRRCCRTGQ